MTTNHETDAHFSELALDVATNMFTGYVSGLNLLVEDFEVLRPNGVLDIRFHQDDVIAIRIEGESGAKLAFQGLRVDSGRMVSDQCGTEIASISSNGWVMEPSDGSTLLAGMNSGEISAMTSPGDPPWVQLNLMNATTVDRVLVQNLPKKQWRNLAGVRLITVSSAGDEDIIYDYTARQKMLFSVAKQYSHVAPWPMRGDSPPLFQATTMFISGDYNRGHSLLKRSDVSPTLMASLLGVLDGHIFADRALELTSHGVRRSFRYWKSDEKQNYVRNALSLVEGLEDLTPYVCLGYGSVLAAIRDGQPIPHDDDLDLIVAFEPEQAYRIPDALRLVERHLRDKGFTVKGDFRGHRHVIRPDWEYKLDLFVGVFDDGKISWIPGERNAFDRSDVFPPMTTELCGIEIPVPRRAEYYLETVYGSTWRVPDPGFRHRFDPPGFDDLLYDVQSVNSENSVHESVVQANDDPRKAVKQDSVPPRRHSRIRQVLRPRTRVKKFFKRLVS